MDKILDTAGQKGTGKWTGIAAAGPGHPAHPDRRGGLRPLPLGDEGRARGGRQGARRARRRKFAGDQQAVRRGHPRGALRLQDRLLRPGLHAHARGGQGVRLEPQLRRHRPDVARRLHHPLASSWARSRRPSTRTRTSTNLLLDPFFKKAIEGCAGAWRSVVATAVENGHPGAGLQHGAGLLRRLPQRAAAGQPAAGPARLLRRPHLRARGQAARRVLPHQLDRRAAAMAAPRRSGRRARQAAENGPSPALDRSRGAAATWQVRLAPVALRLIWTVSSLGGRGS
ncbi:MAG: hypothetical protein M0C28_19375 [Candidatus Moduliflexus flocculans]|nr:hypothetical protein [Candidatus Moduliflexus flocculans]